ncbi:hypothetical protein B0O99DRAFT_681297 [Bisporella sp. PMI_857]|nr:hypothetical protein B0O99DRAFT_681297 [Bisporella sp. PMI_857]
MHFINLLLLTFLHILPFNSALTIPAISAGYTSASPLSFNVSEVTLSKRRFNINEWSKSYNPSITVPTARDAFWFASQLPDYILVYITKATRPPSIIYRQRTFGWPNGKAFDPDTLLAYGYNGGFTFQDAGAGQYRLATLTYFQY